MLKLPRHTLDHKPVLVSVLDPAWDRERINAEVEAMGDKGRDHTWVQYARGDTRFDLNASGSTPDGDSRPVDYLTKGGYTRFILSRLDTTEMMRLQDEFTTYGTDNVHKVQEECGRLGLMEVQGIEGFELRRSGGRVTDASMRVLFEAGEAVQAGGGVALLSEIGNAVFAVSRAKTDSEKKR